MKTRMIESAPSTDHMRKIANGLRHDVLAMYARAISSSQGYQEVVGFLNSMQVDVGPGSSAKAGLMRAIAKRLIPGTFAFQVLESMDGQVELVITGYTAFHPL